MNSQPKASNRRHKDPPVSSAGRGAALTGAMANFADIVAPQLRALRDPYYGVAIPPRDATEAQPVRVSRGTWVMAAVAGVALGVAFTLMLAGA